ncbi:uncharacterized protein LOC105690129 [Athalia rosae]|uniref:uncharacterized protein LOC105690129 n=1 Tax=Athalia rosae TaxID=37344 RepID=UPI0020347A98|nr:uncharacterized protein LOC105690129 [Athalia rosae]
MEHNRIQKLLLSEYCEFSDTVLIESPFAQTTRDGKGLREVALGLTPSRLIIAADILNKNSEFMCPPDLDPSIESFELVSVFPLEYVALSIFRRRRRRTLKARLIDGRANYYELGGMDRRGMFWTLWCERIQSIIADKGNGSSLSETTAASSSSASTLYLLSSEVEIDGEIRKSGERRSVCRIWAHYGGAGDGSLLPTWPRKDLFLGPSHDQLGYGYYAPVPVRFAGASLDDLIRDELKDYSSEKRHVKRGCYSWPVGRDFGQQGENLRHSGGLCDVLFTRDRNLDFSQGIRVDGLWSTEFVEDSGGGHRDDNKKPEQKKNASQTTAQKILNLAPKISRFGFGVRENCSTGLYLEPVTTRHVQHVQQPTNKLLDPYKLLESGVTVWEGGERRTELRRSRKSADRHPRRYGISTAGHFMHALGPWSVQPGERESVQGRRSSSAVAVRRQPPDPELRLPVSRRQLAASVSATALEPGRCGAMGAATRGRVVLFWTPEYWYRPRAATAAYKELRQHLALLRDFQSERDRCDCGNRKTFFTRRKRGSQSDAGDPGEDRSSRILGRIFSSQGIEQAVRGKKKNGARSQTGGGTTGQLRRLLKMDFRVSAWDLDSTTIAQQLTLIDRDLFLRIPSLETEIVVYQRTSRNAPNLGAWIAFSHRVSCLIASEILNVKKIESRARLIARMINAAKKCHATGNFHSTRSILVGLQSPPIYRLKATWSHLRIHHATKYQTVEKLCKIYRSPRTDRYRRNWARAEHVQPAMPYVGDLLVRLLGINYERRRRKAVTKTLQPKSEVNNNSVLSDSKYRGEIKPRVSLARRIISATILKLRNGSKSSPSPSGVSENIEGPWNARQRRVARRAYERWRSYVTDLRMIAENDAKMTRMDDRKKRVIEVASWLADCQRSAQNYGYPGHSLAWEFLLKARYKEDRENFFISLKLEPPSI